MIDFKTHTSMIKRESERCTQKKVNCGSPAEKAGQASDLFNKIINR
jgi:hypothetical protein